MNLLLIEIENCTFLPTVRNSPTYCIFRDFHQLDKNPIHFIK